MNSTKSFRCLAIEAKDLFGAMHQEGIDDCEYKITSPNGALSLKKFTNTFDWSLDAIKLMEAYKAKYRRKDFAFKAGRHWYTKNIICVTFKYSYKEYNMAGKNTYVLNGYSYRNCNFVDGVDIRDNKLIAIQTNVEIKNPVSKEILGKNFTYEDGYYKQVGVIPTIMDKAELRNYLYKNGFKCEGIEYVRYKRSSGSSRVGKCLFVNKKLANSLNKWDKCGVNVNEGQSIDLAAWEAYIALPMSSIIDTINIPLDSMLVIEDYDSVFQDEVVAVKIKDEHLVSERKEVSISNSIWDGQSLMDKSLFGKYEDKGMLLLRNRFFKSCCFNTNIQEWFKDNSITEVSQLNGFTLAKDISQIKFITTPSSIKYTKFGTVEQWIENIEPVFGVVKYEKEPKAFGGRLVQAHYQLFNTLQLSYEEMEKITKPALDYISAIRKDPAVLRYAIKYPVETGGGLNTPLTSKNEIVFKMLGINDNFAGTKMYQNFRDDLVSGELRNLKKGHVLINGNYSTLMGNGLEMLQSAIGQFKGESILGVGNIHCKRFEYDKTLLASRSPHVTMGNILLAHNIESDIHDKYFNLTNSIVCINAINENIQQRLNGCDYDSDTMLLTDNEILIAAAQRNYNNFLVPTNLTTSVKTKRKYTCEDKADLDVKTSVNKIGEIINLSQQLNSILWDRVSKKETIESCGELYNDICKLAVLSNVEIDRAKREFVINSSTEIGILKEKYKITENDKSVKPNFFKMITTENGFKLSKNIKYKYFNTSMDYLQKILSKFNFRTGREFKKTVVPFMDMVKMPPNNIRQGYYYNQRDKIVEEIRFFRDGQKRLYIGYDSLPQHEKEFVRKMAAEIREDCTEVVSKLSGSAATMYLVLRELDKKEFRDVARFAFEVLFSKGNETFFSMIEESRDNIYSLEEAEDGDIDLYGFKFKHVLIKEKEKLDKI